MELAFPWPVSQGEWLAWSSAAVTALIGLVMLLAPRLALKVMRLRPVEAHPEAVAEVRGAAGGFHLGIGLSAILFAQPLVYLALGLCWAVAAFGRFVSMLSDGGNTPYNWLRLILEGLLGALALVFALGIVA
jgi:hypothetical protein